MPLTTKEDVLRYVKERAGVFARRAGDHDARPTDADDALLERYFADALAEICQRTGHAEGTLEITLQPDTASYDLPGSVDTIHRVEYASEELQQGPGEDVRSAAQAGTGAISHYSVLGRTLWIDQAPTQATLNSQGDVLTLVFEHSGEYDDEATGGDLPTSEDLLRLLPRKLQKAAALYVMATWLQDVGLPDLAGSNLTQFEQAVESARSKPNRPASVRRTYRGIGL
jgi:hypothetical protein